MKDVEVISVTAADESLIVVRVVKDMVAGDDQAIEAELHRASLTWDAHQRPFKSWRRIDESRLPTDRTFRQAWRDSGQHVYHDMPRCRELYRERVRGARAPKLAQLDVEYQRALEENNVGYRNQVIAKKRKLRDATDDPRIEAATSPEELKLLNVLEE